MDTRTLMLIQSTIFILVGLLLTLPGNYYEKVTNMKVSGQSVHDTLLGEKTTENTTHTLFGFLGLVLITCGVFEIIILGTTMIVQSKKQEIALLRA